jgi:hypothetical protein
MASEAWPSASRHRAGLVIERRISVEGGTLSVESEVTSRASARSPFALVEHLILGGSLLDDGARLELPGARVVPLHDDGPPLLHTARTGAWPHVDRGDGPEDWSALAPGKYSRFGAVHDVVPGHARVVAPGAGVGVRLEWTADTLPYLWLWAEFEGSDGWPENERIRCLGLEPATAPTAEGVSQLAPRGVFPALEPGGRFRVAVSLSLDPPP